MKVLVTGGAGYIGSHTVVQLVAAGHVPVLLDNFVNAKPAVLQRIEQLTGQAPLCVRGDVRDQPLVERLLREHDIEAVIHFAGLKAVGESGQLPLAYYDANVHGSVALLQAMRATGVRTLVFSSSATVYGDPPSLPIREDFPTGAANPYGRTKWMVEQIVADLAAAEPAWSLTLLRYFNPVGAHPSGLIGEDPNGIPNNLVPFIAQVAVGRREKLRVFGADYDTPDGTGVRDYLHVEDLAAGHLAALGRCHGRAGLHVYNLGTGRGVSVLEMLRAFSAACGKELQYEVVARRPGDIGSCWADASKAERELGWRASRTLEEMTADAWRWQSASPNGYPE